MSMFTQRAPIEVLPKNRDGNLRSDDLFHNASWFDALSGEKLGWGDLDALDVARIRDLLPEGAGVILVGESDSYWDATSRGLNLLQPGHEYLAEKAAALVQKGRILAFDDYAETIRMSLLRAAKLLPCEVYPRDQAQRFIYL